MGVDRDPISEELCKPDEIQSSIAWIFGLSMALGTIVGLLVAIPYGVLTDLQRKPVYLLVAIGRFTNIAWSLPALEYWRMLPAKIKLKVTTVALYSIISDVNAPELAELPLPHPLWSPWVPMSLSLVVTALAGVIILLLPETAHSPKKSHGANDTSLRVKDQAWRNVITSQVTRDFYNSGSHPVLKKRSVALSLLVFVLASQLSTGMGSLFLQYYSPRFGKSIKDAGYMLAIRGGLTLVVVGALLPISYRYLGSSACLQLSTFRREFVLAQASDVFAGLGHFLLGDRT
ncbi:hypothetical protein F4859DRAFT_524652 [Xylaria cf. heliscus]|nr:hypothetical protein F4859DRAFT_524652 [Xylaria cf. heliscus]